MESAHNINKAILAKTLELETDFPELAIYLSEMPVTVPNLNNPAINLKNLKDYYNSLSMLLKKYALTHVKVINNH